VSRRVTGCILALFTALSALGWPLSAQQSDGSGWRRVYAVDTAGRSTFGDKAQLLDAVRAGLPVRVGWGIAWRLPDGTAGGLEHVAEAAFLTIHHGEVFAQIAPILGQAPSAREPVVTFRTEGDRLWYALLDTTGRLHHYFTGGAEAQTTRTATHWYVAGAAGANQRRLY
jgi:hypothetical protein